MTATDTPPLSPALQDLLPADLRPASDYWQGQVQMLEEQMEAMQKEPLVV